ncbi:helix-turn-helix transcriptional regulator [Microbacterium kunmingense]|uniref:helix-turn-helix transcriptional regulator n=1 Tax=Microbacterium kunmingense TaxID=2915939 RepID=UPI00249EFE82|nr:LuxR C-terminal-related transcriptional regulator [Microbacterium kunmingense]
MTVYDPSSPLPTARQHTTQQHHAGWLAAFRHGDDALRAWVLSHPPEVWSTDPGLLLAMAATYRWEGAEGAWTMLPYLEQAESLIDADPDAPGRTRASAALLRCLAERSRGDLHAALIYAERTLEILASTGTDIRDRLDLRSAALLKRGSIHALRGDLPRARSDLERGLRDADSDLTPRKRVEALGFLAIIEALTGALPDAERVLHRARPVADRMPGGLWSAPLEIAELLIAAERSELGANAPTLRRLVTEVEGSEFDFLAQHLLALLAEESGDTDGRRAAIRRLRIIEQQGKDQGLLRLLRMGDRAEALLDLGDLARTGAALRDDRDHAHLLCAAALRARAALAIGDARAAVAETRSCLLEEDHPVRSLVASAAVDAEARVMIGDTSSADAAFRLVLREAVATGAQRALRRMSPSVRRLLAERAREGSDPDAAESALLAELASSTLPPETPSGPTVALSPRERVVLARLAAGESPRAIAQALHVSLNTVKTQVRSTYRKLGASTRDGAVERALILGVLTTG